MIRVLFILIFASILYLPAALPSHAQQGGLGDIFEDIFKTPPQNPIGGPLGGASQTYIDNIPVQISFDARPDLLPTEATLIVTAIAPPPSNVRRASPLILGETRLLISRLSPPLQLVIAVPSDMARELDFAYIDARIMDRNGNTAYRLRDKVEYRGAGAPFLALEPAGAFPPDTSIASNTGVDAPGSPQYAPPKVQRLKGTITLPDKALLARGSTLILDVTETPLAGGFGTNIVKTQRIDIDQKTAPFLFDVTIPVGPDGRLESPQLTAYIEDWAGRKTFVYPRPVDIQLDAATQTLSPIYIKLDPLITGARAADPEQGNYVPPAGAVTAISGEARFNAYKGLPKGSVLTVYLRDSERPWEILGQTDINLDNLSGNIGFNFEVASALMTAHNRVPVLTAQITDIRGRQLFANANNLPLSEGFNPITLVPDSRY